MLTYAICGVVVDSVLSFLQEEKVNTTRQQATRPMTLKRTSIVLLRSSKQYFILPGRALIIIYGLTKKDQYIL